MKVFFILQVIAGLYIAFTARTDIQFLPGIILAVNGISFYALYHKK